MPFPTSPRPAQRGSGALALAALLALGAAACTRAGARGDSAALQGDSAAAAAAEAARRDPAAGPALTGDEQVEHVLSRASYGPRPGDRERVARLGPAAFLEEQLHPGRIDDGALEQKLSGLPALGRSSAELSQELSAFRRQQKEKREQEARAEAEKRAAEAAKPQGEVAKAQGEAAKPLGEAAMAAADPAMAAAGAAAAGTARDPAAAAPARPATAPAQQAARPDQRRRGLRKTLGKLGRGPGFDFTVQLAEAKLARAVYSERQLLEVMTDFWFNHFNVFAGKDREAALLPEYEREVIRAHALGNFRDLLFATAKSPAMLIYLDNWRSTTDRDEAKRPWYAWWRDPVRQRQPAPLARPKKRGAGLNENYARELLELHTLGVDGGYTQADVTEVARCFTGWSVAEPESDPRFAFRPRQHDRGTKQVLKHTIASGGGVEDGEQVLEILVKHPSTARFLATKLARRFVSDDPPPGVVAEMAAAYTASGGEITAMLRALFTSPDFWSRRALKAKMRSPLELVAASARALGADVEEPLALARAVARIGEPLYAAAPPTGYADTTAAWATSGALLARIDFGLQLAQGQLDGVDVDLAPLSAGASGNEEVLDRAARSLGAGPLSEQTRAAVLDQLREVPAKRPELAAQRAVGLLLGAPELQRR